MNKDSLYNPYEELPLVHGVDPKYKKYRKIAKMSLLLSFFSFVLAAVSLHSGCYRRDNNNSGDLSISAADAQLYESGHCLGEWDYSTQQIFTLTPENTGLIIGTRIKGAFDGKKTKAVVLLNPELENPKVTFDLHFSNLEDQDEAEKRVHIDAINEQDGTLHLKVVVDGRRRDSSFCFNYDVTIEVPTLDRLRQLSLSVPHSDITVEEPFTFENYLRLSNARGEIWFAKEGVRADSLDVSTASGYIHFVGATASTDTHLSSASGDINAGFDKLGGNVVATAASGNIMLGAYTLAAGDQRVKLSAASGTAGLVVTEIEEGQKQISISTVKGEANAFLPETFMSDFKLSVIHGRMTVEASDPQQLHYDRKNSYDIRGHYGDPSHKAGSVTISSITGDIKLKYA
ncbi:hypothetical protein BX666DRAFT_2006667 [Dichotomocladium elegans]|nr:hypothetical protein BX666DRAFT_2006667 [Dichotomocladium elegans]